MSEIELAWAAGLFDGEGTISLVTHRKKRKTKTYEYKQVHVLVSQSGSPEVLERFQRAVGGLGKIYGPYERGHQPVFQFNIFRKAEILAMFSAIGPYLSSHKQAQIDAAMASGILAA